MHIGDGDLGPPRPRRDLGEAGLRTLDPGGLLPASLLTLILVRNSQSVNRSVTQKYCVQEIISHTLIGRESCEKCGTSTETCIIKTFLSFLNVLCLTN